PVLRVEDDERACAEMRDIQPLVNNINIRVVKARGVARQRHIGHHNKWKTNRRSAEREGEEEQGRPGECDVAAHYRFPFAAATRKPLGRVPPALKSAGLQ